MLVSVDIDPDIELFLVEMIEVTSKIIDYKYSPILSSNLLRRIGANKTLFVDF